MSPSMQRRLPLLLTILFVVLLHAAERIGSGFETPASDTLIYCIFVVGGLGMAFNQIWMQLDTQGKRMRQLEEELASLRSVVADRANASDGIRLP